MGWVGWINLRAVSAPTSLLYWTPRGTTCFVGLNFNVYTTVSIVHTVIYVQIQPPTTQIEDRGLGTEEVKERPGSRDMQMGQCDLMRKDIVNKNQCKFRQTRSDPCEHPNSLQPSSSFILLPLPSIASSSDYHYMFIYPI